jgi:hypothetical protein
MLTLTGARCAYPASIAMVSSKTPACAGHLNKTSTKKQNDTRMEVTTMTDSSTSRSKDTLATAIAKWSAMNENSISVIRKNSKWDEGGVYLNWLAIEEIRETLVDYLQMLTSNPDLYEIRTVNKIRLQLSALGARDD